MLLTGTVVGVGAGSITNLNVVETYSPNGSVARTVTKYVPGTVGVPVIQPDIGWMLSPGGRPLVIVHVSGSPSGSDPTIGKSTGLPSVPIRVPGLVRVGGRLSTGKITALLTSEVSRVFMWVSVPETYAPAVPEVSTVNSLGPVVSNVSVRNVCNSPRPNGCTRSLSNSSRVYVPTGAETV